MSKNKEYEIILKLLDEDGYEFGKWDWVGESTKSMKKIWDEVHYLVHLADAYDFDMKKIVEVLTEVLEEEKSNKSEEEGE